MYDSILNFNAQKDCVINTYKNTSLFIKRFDICVAIIGEKRMGKSFLFNLIIGYNPQGTQVIQEPKGLLFKNVTFSGIRGVFINLHMEEVASPVQSQLRLAKLDAFQGILRKMSIHLSDFPILVVDQVNSQETEAQIQKACELLRDKTPWKTQLIVVYNLRLLTHYTSVADCLKSVKGEYQGENKYKVQQTERVTIYHTVIIDANHKFASTWNQDTKRLIWQIIQTFTEANNHQFCLCHRLHDAFQRGVVTEPFSKRTFPKQISKKWHQSSLNLIQSMQKLKR